MNCIPPGLARAVLAINDGENRYRQTVLGQGPLPGHPVVQRDLFAPRLPFPAGSQPVTTSEAAADSQSPERLNALRIGVLRKFAAAGELGLTADEVTALFEDGQQSNTYAPRVTELLQIKYVDRLDGEDNRPCLRRKTRRGGSGFVHRINGVGASFLASLESSR